MTDTADDLLRRILKTPNTVWFEAEWAELNEAIRAYIEAPKDEPVYLARRKGLDDFFTCSKDRYEELSELDLFETKLAYLHPPTKTAPMKPLTGDEIQEAYKECPLNGTLGHFVAGVRFAERHHFGIGERDE